MISIYQTKQFVSIRSTMVSLPVPFLPPMKRLGKKGLQVKKTVLNCPQTAKFTHILVKSGAYGIFKLYLIRIMDKMRPQRAFFLVLQKNKSRQCPSLTTGSSNDLKRFKQDTRNPMSSNIMTYLQ